MSELLDTLGTIKAKILRYGSRSISEQSTKSALIQPVLRALGWDVENLEEVELEYKRRRSDKPVDYALLLLRTPCLFVEAKALGQSLDDRRWANQLMGYASVAGVEWVALTNGDEYRIYNSHAPVPVEEKLFRCVKVTDDEAAAAETLRLLSKERIRDNELTMRWKLHFVDRQVRAAVEGLFSTESDPDASLVRAIRKRVHNLTTKDIKASLRRVRIHFDFPEELASDLGESTTKRAPSRRAKRGADGSRDNDAARGKTHVGVSLQQLVASGLFTTPLRLSNHYKGRDLEATLRPDGAVEFQGKRYTSCSSAAAAARGTVIGGKPSTNGWTFWEFRDEAGQLVPLDRVRKEYLSGSIIAMERRRSKAGKSA